LNEEMLLRPTGRKGWLFSDAAGLIDWSLSVESMINSTRRMLLASRGWIELHEAPRRAA
jgi:hypothetical protein